MSSTEDNPNDCIQKERASADVGAYWLFGIALAGNASGGLAILFGKAHPPLDLDHME